MQRVVPCVLLLTLCLGCPPYVEMVCSINPRYGDVCPQAEVGGLLLPAAAPDARREGWCDCLPESSGVLALVLKKLGVVIDTGEGRCKIVFV